MNDFFDFCSRRDRENMGPCSKSAYTYPDSSLREGPGCAVEARERFSPFIGWIRSEYFLGTLQNIFKILTFWMNQDESAWRVLL